LSTLNHRRLNSKKTSKKISLTRSFLAIIRQMVRLYKLLLFCLIIVLCAFYSSNILAIYHKYADFLANKSNFNLQKVYLEGNEHVNNVLVAGAMDVRIGQPIFSISLRTIKDNLEQIDWVREATIIRKLPNSVTAIIKERTAIALWQNEGKLYLIDEEGVPIIEQNLIPFKDLVILIGEDAPLLASSFIKLLKKDEGLYRQISSATRVGERRWNVKFYNGLEVRLPEKKLEKSWDYIIFLYKNKNLFAQGVTNIDLRVDEKLYVK